MPSASWMLAPGSACSSAALSASALLTVTVAGGHSALPCAGSGDGPAPWTLGFAGLVGAAGSAARRCGSVGEARTLPGSVAAGPAGADRVLRPEAPVGPTWRPPRSGLLRARHYGAAAARSPAERGAAGQRQRRARPPDAEGAWCRRPCRRARTAAGDCGSGPAGVTRTRPSRYRSVRRLIGTSPDRRPPARRLAGRARWFRRRRRGRGQAAPCPRTGARCRGLRSAVRARRPFTAEKRISSAMAAHSIVIGLA